VTLALMALLLVGLLTGLYLAWKLIPRLFRWMVADNDIRKSLRRTLVVVGCAAVMSLLVFLARSQSNEPSPQAETASPSASAQPVTGETPVAPDTIHVTPTQEREAEKQPPPNTVPVIARGAGVVPGAIVCPDFQTVSTVFHQYSDYWEDAQQDAMTHGQSRLLRGEPTPRPDFALYDCALVVSGTPMRMEVGNIVPLVTAQLPDGSTIKGVTLPPMITTE
jgi:hypothetical protein